MAVLPRFLAQFLPLFLLHDELKVLGQKRSFPRPERLGAPQVDEVQLVHAVVASLDL